MATIDQSEEQGGKRKPEKKESDLATLLSKIEIELEDGKKRKFSKKDVDRAEECLNDQGKVLISFKKIDFDGTGTGGGGTGTQVD